MLSGIFQKRKKIQELRSPALQDIKKYGKYCTCLTPASPPTQMHDRSLCAVCRFRDVYARNAERRHVETPSCLEKSVYKAISCQKELHSADFRQEDITDPQLIALAETLMDMPMISSLDLRDNRITDDGAKAILEVLRLQIIAAKTPLRTDPKTKMPIFPAVPEYTRYVTHVNMKGNEISATVLQELAQYTDILKREDKRVEIRAALAQIDRNSSGGIDEDEFKAVLKLLTGAEPSKKEVKVLVQQHVQLRESTQSAISLENLLLAKCSSSPSKRAACPPWEALVQVRHAALGHQYPSQLTIAKSHESSEPSPVSESSRTAGRQPSQPQATPSQSIASRDGLHTQHPSTSQGAQRIPAASSANTPAKLALSMPPPLQLPILQQQQSPASSNSPDHESAYAKLKADFKPPASPPPLPLSQTPSPDSRGSYSSRFQSSSSLRDASETAVESPREAAKAPISPPEPMASPTRGSISPDRMSVQSSTSSFTHHVESVDNLRQSATAPTPVQRYTDEDDKTNATPSAAHSIVSESPRWRDDDIFIDDDDSASHGDIGGDNRDDDASNDGNLEDDAQTKSSHDDAATSYTSKASHSSGGKHPGHRGMDSGTLAGEIAELSDGEGDSIPQATRVVPDRKAKSSVSSDSDNDLSSLIYHATEGSVDGSNSSAGRHAAPSLPLSLGVDIHAEQEGNDDDDDSSEARMDSIVTDVTKDGKPRSIAKIIHAEFKRGMVLTDFPNEIPFRNLIALMLSENGLPNLALFKECRFPCALVLDLSKNKLTKLADEDLLAFPKLQVLNLANNRLRSIQGLGKVFDLKALNVDDNAMKTVKNIEHLVHLQALKISGNFIGNISALRLLSLNKMLTHLDLDGNPIVETDERQKRKNIVHILNLMPTLLSLGSIPCASLHSKEKKKTLAQGSEKPVHRKSLFEDEMFPDFKSLWVAKACEILQYFQDAEVQAKRRASYNDDDEWGGSEDGDHTSSGRPRKPLNREQQRQRDELRSRAVGYRSREKALPSPPKVKTSVYSFGLPLPPPSPMKKVKKAPLADPGVVKQQQRRASELSAPKHQPVDKTLLHQEQKRKSRPTFDLNMSVAERLLLAQEKAQRRSSSNVAKGLNRTGLQGSRSIATGKAKTPHDEQSRDVDQAGSSSTSSRKPSPTNAHQDVVAFRIEPLRSCGSPAKPSVEESNQQTSKLEDSHRGSPRQLSQPQCVKEEQPQVTISSPPKPAGTSKESNFLHDLAVTDFLNHAEEEFSTALTALNVLLTMSEKEMGDKKKLLEYRSSLEALDILDERESHALYAKIRDYRDHAKGSECAQAFARLGAVKKSMSQLLEKLEVHEPGSSVVRAFCRLLRTTDLRDILKHSEEQDEEEDAKEELHTKPNDTFEREDAPLPTMRDDDLDAAAPSPGVNSRIFAFTPQAACEVVEKAPSPCEVEPETAPYDLESAEKPLHGDNAADHFSAEDDEFDFLSSDASVFDDDACTSDATTTAVSGLDFLDIDEKKSPSPVPAAAYSPKTDSFSATTHTDIAEDIQSHRDSVLSSADEEVADIVHDTSNLREDTTFEASNTTPVEEDDAWLTAIPQETRHELDAGDEFDAGDTSEDLFEAHHHPGDSKTDIADTDEHTVEPVADSEEHHRQETQVAHTDEVTPEPTADESGEDTELLDDQEQVAFAEEGENQEFEVEMDASLPAEEPDEQPLSEAEDADDEEAETFGDWEKGFDPNTNHYFWFNHETGESAWTPPEGWPFEVDTPFEADGEYSVDGGEEGEVEYVAEDVEAIAEAGDYDAEEATDQHAEWEGEDEHSAIESSQRLSEFDDDMFSDQDLPSF